MKKIYLTIIGLIFLFPTIALASSLENYVPNLDTSYYDGTIDITAFNDRMLDTDSNSLNDTLYFNLTTDYATSGNYTAILFFYDETIPSISDTEIISSTNPSFQMNISSFYLKNNQYSYFVRIFNQIGQIIFESKKTNTSSYTNYETGTNITSISDNNFNNNYLRINLSLNVKRNETVNITVNLKYNDSIISGRKEVSLTTPSQLISIDIDNETIKSTHYKGTYNISSIIVGNKIFDIEHTTSSYDYENFAKTSYFKSYSEGLVDINGNNLSEYLEVNFTTYIFTAGTYNIEGELRDYHDNFIVMINETESLSTGSHIFQARFNGSEIYKTYTNGPYVLSYAKLSCASQLVDFAYEPYTTGEFYYSSFERPQLPDLTLLINTSFSEQTNETNVTINLANKGSIPAFNVFLEIFDNSTYENETSLNYLNSSQSEIISFVIANSSNSTLITAIADFSNLIDESNETNNIAQNIQAAEQTVSLTIESLENISTIGTLSIFEFVIYNDGEAAVTDIQWKLNMGDGNILNSSQNISSLAAGKKARVYARFNYSEEGYYNVIANATGIQASAYKTLSFGSTNEPYIDVNSLELLSQNSSLAVFGFNINNTASQTLNNINWSVDTGNGALSANSLISISPNKTLFVFARHNYTQKGLFTATASATDGTYQDSESLSLKVKDIEVSDLTLLNISNKNAIFEFVIGNNLAINLTNATWQFNTRDNNIINSSYAIALQPNKEAFVYVRHNFSQSGTFNVNATAINGNLTDSVNLSVVLE